MVVMVVAAVVVVSECVKIETAFVVAGTAMQPKLVVQERKKIVLLLLIKLRSMIGDVV